MKSAQFFKDEIEKLRSEMAEAKTQLNKNYKMDEKLAKQLRGTVKRNRKKIEEYTLYLRYAETNPSEDYLKKEIDRITNRINKFTELYKPLDETAHDKKKCAAHKKDYEKEMGIPKLRKQLSTICFISN
ncbi:MAG: hypothetical protein V4547_17075 [Bacteroidota bacterium]